MRGWNAVGNISNGLSDRAEERWTAHPAHGESGWESNDGLFAIGCRKNDAEPRDGGGRETNAVETIGKVNLGHVDWAIFGIGTLEAVEQTLECATKLHCFVGRQRWGVKDYSCSCCGRSQE